MLNLACTDRVGRSVHVKNFQQLIWDSIEIDADPETSAVLRDLAYDLDFYEQDEQIRAEDPALYGDDRLVQEISSAMSKLEHGNNCLTDKS